jgi:dihydrofolate synthase/folylpolyglutamate synthase
LRIPLLGEFQLENAALAIGATEALTVQGVKISSRDIEQGLRVVRWPARFQVLQKSPLIIIDGAHNMYSLQSLMNSLRKYLTFKKVFVIFGASKDKDIAGMSRTLSLFADKIVLIRSGHPRAADTEYLQRYFSGTKDKISAGKDIGQGLEDTLSIACANDLILVTGSLFLAAEAAAAYAKTHRRKTPPTITDERCSRALRQ